MTARVGILGAGFIADIHAQALRSIDGARVTAVCDLDSRRAASFGRRWNIPAQFTSLAEMLERADVDVVHVLLPPPAHAAAAVQCLERGRNLFLEKPMAPHAGECLAIEAAAERHGRIVGVNHNAIFHPGFRRLLARLRERRLGAVQHVTACLNVPLRQLSAGQHDHWMFHRPGNILLEQAPHPLAQLGLLVGPPVQVRAMVSGGTTLNTGVRFHDTWLVSMECLRGTAQCRFAFGKDYADSWLHVIGEDGAAFLDLRRNTLQLGEKTRFLEAVDHLWNSATSAWALAGQGCANFAAYVGGFLARRPVDPFFASMAGSIQAFYEALGARRSPPATAADGRQVVETCLRILESAGLEAAAAGAPVSQPEHARPR